MKTKMELLKELRCLYGDLTIVVEEYKSDNQNPLIRKGILKETGRALRIFDNFGSEVAFVIGYVPVEGGNVIYC